MEPDQEMIDMHLDALEDALGTKIKDREGFIAAFRGLVSCCSGGDEEDVAEGPEEGGKSIGKAPSIAVILGGPAKKGAAV